MKHVGRVLHAALRHLGVATDARFVAGTIDVGRIIDDGQLRGADLECRTHFDHSGLARTQATLVQRDGVIHRTYRQLALLTRENAVMTRDARVGQDHVTVVPGAHDEHVRATEQCERARVYTLHDAHSERVYSLCIHVIRPRSFSASEAIPKA